MELYEYLKETFGSTVVRKKMPAGIVLPLYLKNGYSFDAYSITDIKVLFAKPKEKMNITNYQKQLIIISELFKMPTVIVLDSFDARQRKWFVENKISFVVIGSQLFIPLLGMVLTERMMKGEKILPVKFTPSTQLIYLYLLYKMEKDIYKYQGNIESMLGLNRMTLKRGLENLQQLNLIECQYGYGRTMCRKILSDSDYIERGKSYLTNPCVKSYFIKKEVFYRYERASAYAIEAGITALAERTMIADDKFKCYAISKEFDNGIVTKDKYDIYLDGYIRIEVWKYNPLVFRKNNGVDNISLFATLCDSKDERVLSALDNLLEEYR